MNELASKIDPQPKTAISASQVASTTSLVRLLEEVNGKSRAARLIKPVPFNGLLTNKLLTELPGEDFARLLPHLMPVSLSCGEVLYGLGETISHIYFPETAIISHLYFMKDGSTTAAAMIGRDGLVGLSTVFNAAPLLYYTQVTIGGSALRVEKEVIKQEFDCGGAMQQLLLSYTSTRLAQLSQRAVCNGRHRADERLSTWLLMIHDRAGDTELPLTHEEIAHHLGLRRAGITTACNLLRHSGAISYRRGMIHILDRRMLEAAACECYQALTQAFEIP